MIDGLALVLGYILLIMGFIFSGLWLSIKSYDEWILFRNMRKALHAYIRYHREINRYILANTTTVDPEDLWYYDKNDRPRPI